VFRRLHADGLQWRTKQPKPCMMEGHRVGRLAFARNEAVRNWTHVLCSDECFTVLFHQKSKGWRRLGELKPRSTVKHPQKLYVHTCFGHSA